jgi:hypothetical protein
MQEWMDLITWPVDRQRTTPSAQAPSFGQTHCTGYSFEIISTEFVSYLNSVFL